MVMNSEGWKTFKLEEVAEIIGGGTPSTDNSDYWGGEIPWLTPRDLSTNEERFVQHGERNITQSGLKNSSAKLLPKGTILLTTRAPIGYLAIASNPICTNQGFKSLIPNSKVVDNLFLYYLLKNNVEYLKSVGVGTTFAEISGGVLRQIRFDFPELSVQRQIAEILSALDDKIELNRQTNATLEAIAQAIFKEWFVDFNYPGATGEMVESEFGLIPKGWHVVQIGELIGSAYGGDWGTDTKQNEDDILCGVIRGTDFENLSQGFVNAIPRRYIKQKSFVKRRLREGDIIIEISGGSKNQATGRNLWVSSEILALFDRPIVPTSFCRLIRPENIDISLFLGTFLSGFYKAGGTWDYQLQSTGISNFQFNDFSSRQKIVLPDTQALHNFSQIAYLIFSLRGENSKNNYSLTSTLNLLLPKLLRGSLSSFEISEIQSHKE